VIEDGLVMEMESRITYSFSFPGPSWHESPETLPRHSVY
jgi:hypothetical protein